MKDELHNPIARKSRQRAEILHLLDPSPGHLLRCALCRTHFRSILETPKNLDLLFGADERKLTCLQHEETEAYLLGKCNPLEQESIEMHLADCTPCLYKIQRRSLL